MENYQIMNVFFYNRTIIITVNLWEISQSEGEKLKRRNTDRWIVFPNFYH